GDVTNPIVTKIATTSINEMPTSTGRDTWWRRSTSTVINATTAMYAGTTTRIGHTGPATMCVTRSSTPTRPIATAIISRRDDCQTMISALFSIPTRRAYGERPIRAPSDASAGSVSDRRGSDGECGLAGEGLGGGTKQLSRWVC